jgi:nucleoside-diphosphate-sugar epimerase
MTMAGELVLITGGTGHIGSRTLVEALRKGYKVRAAVRSASRFNELKSAPFVQPYLDHLTSVIVPDIEEDGAFDEAVKGVDYIVHLASPLARASDDDETNIIQPAIRGTLSILYSALKEPAIKKVVITSSVAAVAPPIRDKIFTTDNIQPDPHGPYPSSFAAYSASKKLAYNRTREFIQKENPHFNIINIMPSFVVGKNEMAKTKEDYISGSNGAALAPLLGLQIPGSSAFACHVDDVAFVHIAALDPTIEGNQNFGVNSDVNGVQWDDAIEIVKKHFPKEVEQGIFPLGGHAESLPSRFDASKTEKVFGIKFKSYEEQIISLAEGFAEVATAANGE